MTIDSSHVLTSRGGPQGSEPDSAFCFLFVGCQVCGQLAPVLATTPVKHPHHRCFPHHDDLPSPTPNREP